MNIKSRPKYTGRFVYGLVCKPRWLLPPGLFCLLNHFQLYAFAHIHQLIFASLFHHFQSAVKLIGKGFAQLPPLFCTEACQGLFDYLLHFISPGPPGPMVDVLRSLARLTIDGLPQQVAQGCSHGFLILNTCSRIFTQSHLQSYAGFLFFPDAVAQ